MSVAPTFGSPIVAGANGLTGASDVVVWPDTVPAMVGGGGAVPIAVRSMGDNPIDWVPETGPISVVPAAVPFVVHNSWLPLESSPQNSTWPS